MMKKIIISSILGAGLIVPAASAQKYAIKAYDNIGIGNPMSVTHAQPSQGHSSSYNTFGVDFGYTFWRKGGSSLEANIGFGYAAAGATFSLPAMDYHYSAPTIADEDGNAYERYYELSDMRQTASVGYFTLPIYLEYQYRCLSWLGVKAEVGVGLGFRLHSGLGKVSGRAKAWGVFPEYDDLLIDEDYLDDFGERFLTNALVTDHQSHAFNASIMCGAGFEFYAYEPVSFELGVRYNHGLTQVFDGSKEIATGGGYTADTAPVYYTVAGGTQVRPLTEYTSKSKLNPLSIHVGVTVRF